MTIAYSTSLKNTRLQLVADAVAGLTPVVSSGSPSAGSLVIGTSSLSGATGVLATIPLPTIPGTVSNGVLTLSGTPLSATATGAGTAAKAELRNNSGTVVASGLTVGTSGSDINLNSVTISVGQTVTCSSGSVTHG